MSDQGPKPVTPGQIALLNFFGCMAQNRWQASKVISELLAIPANKQRWICERARRCVASMQPAVSGSHGHDATFAVACALIHGFALSYAEAMTIFQEYNLRCAPPWSDRELDYKLRSAEKASHEKPRGHLIGDDAPPPSRVASMSSKQPASASNTPLKKLFDPEKLRELAKHWNTVVNLVWLANRSVVDPSQVSADDFLRLLFGPDKKVLCFTNQMSQGQAMWPKDALPEGALDGVWFLPQPLDGEYWPNPRAPLLKDGSVKKSRRSEESVREFRYMVLESDQADVKDWLGFIVQVPFRIDAIYTSGGRSVHALVRVDCATKRQWDAYKEDLMPIIKLLCMGGLDPAVMTAVRLTRLPGCWRGDRLQKLLYVRPAAPVRPIMEIPPERDVVKHWCDIARLGVSDTEESNARALQVLNALGYYAPANRECREAVKQFKAACDTAGFDVGTNSQ